VLGSGSFGCVVKGMLKGTTVSTSAPATHTIAARQQAAARRTVPAQACWEHCLLGSALHPDRKVTSSMQAQDVAMKMTLISPEAARRRSLCDRLEAAFMQEIALLKVSLGLRGDRLPLPSMCCLALGLGLLSGIVTQETARAQRTGTALRRC